MKMNKSDQWLVTGDTKARLARRDGSCHASRFTGQLCAFTLVELLTVIAIIAVIAAFLLPLAGAVKRRAYIQTSQTQMAQIETAITRYHAAYGFYPPQGAKAMNGVPVSPLYYELVGTTNIAAPGATPIYQVLGDPSQTLIGGPGGQVSQIFGVGGFMNCSKPDASESAPRAEDFLPGIKPDQFAEHITNKADPGIPFTLLVGSAGGPDPTYQPLGTGTPDTNPWRYVYPGTNNPSSYDLWIQLQISKKKYLICNWSKQVQINNPLP